MGINPFPPVRGKAGRGKSMSPSCLLCLLAMMCVALLFSPDLPAQSVTRLLAPGEKVSGADHPEMFSRRVAFETCLNLLAIDAEDAPHLQRRARMLERNMIGLDVKNSAELEQIVETYRVKRNAMSQRVASLRVQGSIADPQTMTNLNKEKRVLLRETASLINTQLDVSSRHSLNAFVDHIIAKSELHGSGTGVAK